MKKLKRLYDYYTVCVFYHDNKGDIRSDEIFNSENYKDMYNEYIYIKNWWNDIASVALYGYFKDYNDNGVVKCEELCYSKNIRYLGGDLDD